MGIHVKASASERERTTRERLLDRTPRPDSLRSQLSITMRGLILAACAMALVASMASVAEASSTRKLLQNIGSIPIDTSPFATVGTDYLSGFISDGTGAIPVFGGAFSDIFGSFLGNLVGQYNTSLSLSSIFGK